jgi:competence protein ComFC
MNTNCISCQGKINQPFSWLNLITFTVFKNDPLPPIDQWLCGSCLQNMGRLSEIEERCLKCSRSVSEIDKAFVREIDGQMICFDCERWYRWEEQWGMGSILSQNMSAIVYNEWAQEIIRAYKFTRDERLKYFFASLVIETWLNESEQSARYERGSIDIIVPVPLSQERMQERGFNQSALIAKLVADRLDIPYQDSLLLRNRGETKQSKKARDERLEEMLKKFLKHPCSSVDIYNMKILLIDDIYTTGATLHAAAYALKSAGAREVISITIAR